MLQPRPLCFEDRTRRRTFTMYRNYRIIVTVLLYMQTVSTAPQDSSVTFVKIEPFISNETRVDNIPLTAPNNNTFENNEFIRLASNEEFTTEYETEAPTEAAEVTTELTTVQTTTTTRAPKPKFTSSPRFLSKLSHFKNSNSINSISTNSLNSFPFTAKVDRPYKRKFKSSCRCEKIENCPKLQITVPRCPNEYFLCCF